MKETASEFRERMRNLHGTGRSEISFITMPDGKELWYYKAEEAFGDLDSSKISLT